MRFRAALVLLVGLSLVLCPLSLAAEPTSSEAVPPKAFTQESEALDEGQVREELLFGFAKTHGLLTRVQFQLGRTKRYGRSVSEPEHLYGWNNSGVAELEVSTGPLDPDTTYHFRLVATNDAGRSFGKDLAFHTRPLKRKGNDLSRPAT